MPHEPESPAPGAIFALGPQGTFSDQAARRVREGLGGDDPEPHGVPIRYTHTIPEVLVSVEDDRDAWGVIPIENSVAGTVGQAQDGLVSHRVTIIREFALRIRYSLVASVPLPEVRVLYAHPLALDQCAEYLATHLPQAEGEFTRSNMESGRLFLEAASKGPVAALVPREFAQGHPEHLAATDVQTYQNNMTRFLVVRRSRDPERHDFRRRKTSVCIAPRAEEGHEDRPGLLHELLSIFYKHGINLNRLESRPSKSRPWAYVFFIDFTNNAHSETCLAELRQTSATVTVLGSYDALE